MTAMQASAYLQTLSAVLWTVGICGLVIGYSLQRWAETRGIPSLRKAAPSICAAVIVALLLLLAHEGVLHADGPAQPDPAIAPVCDGWLGWVDARCWY